MASAPVDDSRMLRGGSAQVVIDIDAVTPMTDAEEAAAQQRWGGDYRRWPTLQKQQWLGRLGVADRQE